MLGSAVPVAVAAPSAWLIAGVALGAGAAGALGVIVWRRIADHVRVRNFGIVEAGKLYRSGRLTPRTLAKVARAHGVRTVVDLGAYPRGSAPDLALERAAVRLGLTRHEVRGLWGDGSGNANAYVHALRVMSDPEGHPVLVHCAAGAERTGAAVMLYRCLVQGLSMEEAFEEALAHKHDPTRNARMRAFVMEHAASIAEAFRAGEWIESFERPDVRVRGSAAADQGRGSP